MPNPRRNLPTVFLLTAALARPAAQAAVGVTEIAGQVVDLLRRLLHRERFPVCGGSSGSSAPRASPFCYFGSHARIRRPTVVPWITSVNSTTPAVRSRICCRWATSAGRLRAITSGSAPRSPPPQKMIA